MTTLEIEKLLQANLESVRKTTAIAQIRALTWPGKDTASVSATDSSAIDRLEKDFAAAQRALNKQKKLLSLMRKSLLR